LFSFYENNFLITIFYFHSPFFSVFCFGFCFQFLFSVFDDKKKYVWKGGIE